MDASDLQAYLRRVQVAHLDEAALGDLVGRSVLRHDEYVECEPASPRYARARVLGIRLDEGHWCAGFEIGFRSPEPLLWGEAKLLLGAPDRVASQRLKWGAPMSFVFRAPRGARPSTLTVTVAHFDADLAKTDGEIAFVSAVAATRLPGPADLLVVA